MRVADRNVDEFFDVAFTLVPGFLDESALAAARAALWSIFPTPGDYFADPAQFEWLRRGQFAGLREFPFVVPRADGRWRQITTLVYLSDVTEANGATAIMPPRATSDIR